MAPTSASSSAMPTAIAIAGRVSSTLCPIRARVTPADTSPTIAPSAARTGATARIEGPSVPG